MSSIRTYDDLLLEEQRLQQQLTVHQASITNNIAGIREGLKPVQKVFAFVHKLSTRDQTGPLTSFGIDFSIDMLIRKVLLAKAGWFTRIVVPFVLKNYSSHIISEEQKTKFAGKVKSFFNKIRPGKKAARAGDFDPGFDKN